jgi:hypothetical protein
MWPFRGTPRGGPDLSPETLRRVDFLFPPGHREWVKTLLYEECGNNLPFLEKADMYVLERFRFATLKCSKGDLILFRRAITLAKEDWRDLLMASGFHDVDAHRSWEPRPVDGPSET